MSVSGKLKDLSARTGLFRDTVFQGLYPFMFTPTQLQFLTRCLIDTREVTGCVVEAGCAYGATTVYLKKFMAEKAIQRDYVAIDTFSGFPKEHARYEITHRDKPSRFLKKAFTDNTKLVFDTGMACNGFTDVRAVQSDIVEFDFGAIDQIAFCLLDVDLYLPIKAVLPRIYDRLAPGGILVVDDCAPGTVVDGALQAYEEYCSDVSCLPEIECGKLGIIRKRSTQ
jgi:O-methyltransferase